DHTRRSWIRSGRAGGGQWDCRAAAARPEDRAAPPLFGRGRGGKKVVGLVSGCLGIGKTACGDELGQCIKLLEQFVVEFAAALIGGELLVTVGRRVSRVPTYQYGARLLRPVELQQEIREAKDRTGRPASASQNGLG